MSLDAFLKRFHFNEAPSSSDETELQTMVETSHSVVVDITQCSHVNDATLPANDRRRKDKRIKSVLYK